MSKKAQIGTLQTVIITLMVIGVVLGIGFLLLEEFKGTLDEKTTIVYNETAAANNVTGTYVTNNYTTAGIDCYNAFEVIRITNNTTGAIFPSGNYTYDSNGNIISTKIHAVNWNVTYSYKYGTDACSGVVSTIEATGKIPAWLSIIVILIIVGILLAIVFSVIGRGAGGEFAFGRWAGTTAEV